jgi:histidinol-phosphate aminotransferase
LKQISWPEQLFRTPRDLVQGSRRHRDSGAIFSIGQRKTSRSPALFISEFLFKLRPMFSIWDYASHLRDLAVYQPGKPIEETARELGVDASKIVKLASNENPIGPSPKAVAALGAALKNSHLYPDGGTFYLRERLARHLGVARENLILGNGSNEIIEFLGHAFLKRGDDVITSEHAFIAYKLIATLFGARTIETPSPDYQHDLEAMIGAITPKTRLILVVNPNNPTGSFLGQDAIDRFLARVPENIVIVFDEAYFEFLHEPPDTLQYVRAGRNVVVLRTFSKMHGLAGLRVGYGIARGELIEVLQKTRQPFNVNNLAQIAATAALDDQAHQRETRRVVDSGRAYLEGQFAEMQLEFVPSRGNFVMVKVGDGPAVFQKLLRRRIIVRPLNGYHLPSWIRISVGTMEQNRQCIAALREVLFQNHPA